MTAHDDLDRQLRAFLDEGPAALPDPSFDAVRDRMEQTRQRVVIGPWRTPIMNKFVTYGLAAVAVVAVVVIGSQLLRSPTGGVGGQSTPSPTPTPTAAQPTSTPDDSLDVGPFLVFDPTVQSAPFDNGPRITVTIPASGWTAYPENGAIVKGDFADDGVGLLTGDSGAGSFYVYGDPCQWESTTPDARATTVDEIVAALASQAARGATEPVDVTVGGYAGKSITLYVPEDADFSACDQETFATLGVALDGPTRSQQAPGQIDEFWILDVDGAIAVLDATYGPATPAELINEVRAIAESATFESP